MLGPWCPDCKQVVVDALYDSFDAGHDLDTKSVLQAIQRTVPLSVTMAEDIRALRKWAAGRARSASQPDKPATARESRALQLQ